MPFFFIYYPALPFQGTWGEITQGAALAQQKLRRADRAVAQAVS